MGTQVKVKEINTYPYINTKGEIGFGLSIMTEEAAADAFDEPKQQMIIISTSLGKEKEFKLSNMSKELKGMPKEIFERIDGIRMQTTLAAAYKTVKHKKALTGISTSDSERVVKELGEAQALKEALFEKIKEATGSGLSEFLNDYAFKKHVMILGDAGQAKSYTVDKFCKDNNITTVVDIAHNGVEAVDLIGHYIKLPSGNFAWKDGTFSRAFRKAQTEKVAFFLDEALRLPARELNILVGSLTPDSSGMLRLRTNRYVAEIDGVAETEEILVPQENLWVVGTSNQGASYTTNRMDEALKDRFRLFYQKMSPEDIQEIIEIKMEKFKATDREVSAVVSLVEKTEDIQKSGNISRAFTVRHLSEAVDSATSLANVKKKLIELVPNIVAIDSDGAFNPSQVKIITELIKKTI